MKKFFLTVLFGLSITLSCLASSSTKQELALIEVKKAIIDADETVKITARPLTLCTAVLIATPTLLYLTETGRPSIYPVIVGCCSMYAGALALIFCMVRSNTKSSALEKLTTFAQQRVTPEGTLINVYTDCTRTPPLPTPFTPEFILDQLITKQTVPDFILDQLITNKTMSTSKFAELCLRQKLTDNKALQEAAAYLKKDIIKLFDSAHKKEPFALDDETFIELCRKLKLSDSEIFIKSIETSRDKVTQIIRSVIERTLQEELPGENINNDEYTKYSVKTMSTLEFLEFCFKENLTTRQTLEKATLYLRDDVIKRLDKYNEKATLILDDKTFNELCRDLNISDIGNFIETVKIPQKNETERLLKIIDYAHLIDQKSKEYETRAA